MPGPIVVEMAIERRYCPLDAAGLARTTASNSAVKFASSCSSGNDVLPMPVWRIPAFSVRYSIFPALISLTALAMSKVTVPALGLGISPRGPRMRPSRPTTFIRSGVATATSKSIHPPWIFSTRSSAPTWSAPADSASFAFSPLANTSTRTVLPVPAGNATVPRICWSACLESMPSRMATSTVSSNFARPICFSTRTASAGLYNAFGSTNFALSVYRLPCRPISNLRVNLRNLRNRAISAIPIPYRSLPLDCVDRADCEDRVDRLAYDLNSHRSGCPFDHAHRRLNVISIEVPHLLRSDLAQLRAGDLPHFGLVGLAGPLLDSGGLPEQHRCRRSLGDEGKRAIGIDRDLNRDNRANHGRGPLVVRFAELHDVHAMLPQRGTNGRRRRGLARGNLQPDNSNDLLGHTLISSIYAICAICAIHRTADCEDCGDCEDSKLSLLVRSSVPQVWHDRRSTPGRELSPSL